MKAAIICGSRDGGFTAEMCRSFAKGLAVHDIHSEVFFPIDMDIAHCTGCGSCSENGKCNISDDMDIFYMTFGGCDLLVLATPIHFSGPSSVIKTVIDRFQTIWFRKGRHPAFSAALLSGGGPSPDYKSTISIFKAFSATAETEWLGYLAIPNTDEKRIQDVSELSFGYGKDIGRALFSDRQ